MINALCLLLGISFCSDPRKQTLNSVYLDECYDVIAVTNRSAFYAGYKHSTKRHFLIFWVNMNVAEQV